MYTCQYAGVMEVTANGIDEIKATHYGRDMLVGWEGWTFPYMGVYTGTDNRLVTHWMNRQFDMFDLAHQMRLCDDLEEAGLLSPQLKDEWVLPMKGRLIEQLNRNR